LGSDGTTDIFKAKEILRDHMCILGNVPPDLLQLGTVHDVESYCKRLIDIVGEGGGFIMGTGSEVPTKAKFGNLKAMIDIVKTYPSP
ncbi:uroporphyrinogen decarboxylase family protein, partial [Chloroflexota bacterium]